MRLSTESLARTHAKHPWWTILAWIVVLIGAYILTSTLLASGLDGEGGPTKILESERAQNLIDEKFGPLDEAQEAYEAAAGPEPGVQKILLKP